MTHYDLAIIGSGSGNSLPDERFDGKKIAILEEGTFGGTCLNVGCIPTKMFVYAAEVARTVTTAEKYGVDATLDGVRWSDIVKRVFGRIDPISAGGERYRSEDSPNTTVYRGHATFTGDKTIDTGTGETITADQVVIAAGSRPIIPDEIASSGVKYYTNEDIMRLPELPEHLVIVGSGFIATEFAHVFSALGSRVSIIGRSQRLLRHLDDEISERFTELAEQKWDVHLGSPSRRYAAMATTSPSNWQMAQSFPVTFSSSRWVVSRTVTYSVSTRPASNSTTRLDRGRRIPTHHRRGRLRTR